MNINIEQYLSQGTLIDLKKSLKFIPAGRRIALVRIPVEDFGSVMDKICKKIFIPFKPVIFGNIPVDMAENSLPECVLVADDDTNISKTAVKEIELFRGGI